MQQQKDSYYRDASLQAIQQAVDDSKGMNLPAIRHRIRRSYPFGDGDRKGKAYKIWNNLVLETEAKLGMEHQKKTKGAHTGKAVEQENIPTTRQEFLNQNPSPSNQEEAAVFLRKHCHATISMLRDHDKLRVVMRERNGEDHLVQWQYTAELATSEPEEWSRVYLEAAQKSYDIWIDLALEKFKTK